MKPTPLSALSIGLRNNDNNPCGPFSAELGMLKSLSPFGLGTNELYLWVRVNQPGYTATAHLPTIVTATKNITVVNTCVLLGIMFQQAGEIRSRKRGREGDDGFSLEGFQEHRTKRHIASLPVRRSPDHKKRVLPTFHINHLAPHSPTFADITPAGSDSEDVPTSNEPHSFFFPWSSSIDNTLTSSQPSSSGPDSSQSIQETQAYSDDFEMTDSGLIYPGPLQPDSSTNIASRIPTPINSQFFSYIRSGNKENQSMSSSDNYTNDGAGATPIRNSRRLPSPISEDEAISPSLLQGLSDVQMEYEESKDTMAEEPKATPKKGHTRSKYSLRGSCGFGTDLPGVGVRRSFSMGYRSDCEKCRMRVPGHFSHVIIY